MQYPGSLHNHSQYSNLRLRDSINREDELIDYAIELGHEVIAFTEHETVSNAIKIEKYYNKVKKDHPDFKVILGNEIYLCRDGLNAENFEKSNDKYYHFLLLAKNSKGYQQIRELSTRAWGRSWMNGKMRRVPTYYQDLIDIIGAEPGNVIGSTACFTAGHKVLTKNGLKNIEDITDKDYIWNKNGEWERVNFPTSRLYQGNGNLIQLTKNQKTIQCTDEHKFLIYDYINKKTNWIMAKDLKPNMRCLFPMAEIIWTNNNILYPYKEFKEIATYHNLNLSKYSLPEKIEITPELMRLFGLWLADGHIAETTKTIGFTFSLDEYDNYKIFVEEGLRSLGVNLENCCVHKRTENHRVDLQINRIEIYYLFKNLFGISHANNKYIPKRLLNISKELNQELFFGYMLGDGYFRYRKGQGGEIVAASISQQLIKDIQTLGHSIELSGSITYSPARKNSCNHKESWYITFSNSYLGQNLNKTQYFSHKDLIKILNVGSNKQGGFADYIILNGIKYNIIKIKSNQQIKINEQVYCLNVNSHSFCLEGVIVHNCLGGFLDTKLLQWVRSGRPDKLYQQIIGWVKNIENIFGKGNFFLEMQPSASEEQECANKEIFNLSEVTGIPYIITTDSHYMKKEDAPIHKAFLNSQEGDREVDSFYATTYLMSTDELESYFQYFSKQQLYTAYSNIEKIKNMCEDFSLLKELKIPSLDWGNVPPHTAIERQQWIDRIPWLEKFINSNFNGNRVMADLIIEKLLSDKRLQNKESYDELNNNLEMTWVSSEVNKAHWSAYFLNLRGILDACWDAGSLVGPGRGSGVGFYLLYILDIIQINPLWETTKTFAWRFLNPARVSVLDIDTDIEGAKRSQVLAALRKKYGQDRVSNVVTFGTEGSKSAIQTAARGLGLDNDISLYISSLIPADRGKIRTLHQCYYGDEEEGFAPIPLFIQQMNQYPELWEVAQKVEGLVCRVGEHAGGVIFVDEPFTNSTALMKVPNGDTVTQFDLHDCEAASLIKIDLLSIEALDKMHACLDLLCDQGYIDRYPTLKETYEKYLGIYNIEREAHEMWKMVWNHEIQSLFQMEKQSGIQGIALTQPESVDDLAVLNSVIRLMAQEKGGEQPLNKYARFKNNISLWYDEMDKYGLTENEIELLKPVLQQSYGICESQEKLMSLVQIPECGGFDLTWADRLRKSIAKKNPKEYEQLTKEYFENAKAKNLSKNLCNYVWNVLVATSRGYGFNASHTLAYSLVGLQEMNLAYRWPIIFWNCACLITDSGGAEEEEEEIIDIYEPEDFEEFEYEDTPDEKSKKKKRKSNNYDKIATAIGKMRAAGIDITPPDINTSQYTFYPDVDNNRILFGFRGLLNVGDDLIAAAIENRPYISPRDFINKVNPKKSSMLSLIKAGAFDSMMDRKLCMAWYLWETCDKKKELNLRNMQALINYNLIPLDKEEFSFAYKVYEFNRYLKACCKTGIDTLNYHLDERALNFITSIGQDGLLFVVMDDFSLNMKDWDKYYQKVMDVFRNWISENKKELLNKLNSYIFKEEWDKRASKNISAGEMEVMGFYYHEHELAKVDNIKYGFSDFFKLPEDPEVARSFFKGGKEIKLFKLAKICGTCIAKDKAKGVVTLLTPTGVVNVKMNREYFAMFDKQISEVGPDGTKHVIEKSWFNKGSMVVFQGIRSGDMFMPKKYTNSGMSHQLYKITEVLDNGEIVLQTERYQGNG